MKKIIQDVLPPGEKKGIRNIPVPDRTLRSRFVSRVTNSGTKKSTEEDTETEIDSTTEDTNEETEERGTFEGGHRTREKKTGTRLPILLALIFIVLVAGFFVASIWSSVTVKVVRYSVIANFADQKVSMPYGTESSIAKPLSFEIPVGIKVPANEEELVVTKASGKIVIYNNFSTDAQKLIKNTRFEGPNKKIYRIKDSVVVPGQKKVDGKFVPGSIEVTVYADAEGEEYNLELSDFTIPGFKDTPRYATVYARGKTPIAGGFNGKIKKVSAEELAKTKTEIKNQITEKSISEAQSKVPEGFVLFPSLVKITFKDMPQSNIESDSVQINMTGEVTIPLFNINELSKLLALEYNDESLSKEKPFIENINDLNFGNATTLAKDGKTDLSIVVSGSGKIIWPLDEVLLKAKLSGASRKDIGKIFSDYKTVIRAKAFVKPFWKRNFVDDVKKINIEFVDSI